MRVANLAAVGAAGGLAFTVGAAYAEPRIAASGFVGVDWFGAHTELGNSWAREQVPGTAPLVGGRLSWFALALPADLALAVEGELAFAPSFTGDNPAGGRMAYFAPVFEWRAHAQLRLARWGIQPHLVLGAGGETIASSSPFMSSETDPIAYWGPGLSMRARGRWHLRLDVRHGVMPARDGGATSTFAIQLGVGTVFERPARRERRPPPPPVDSTDRDGDGIPDRLDRCPDQPETVNGIADDDGCPETDPDGDGIVGDADRCPDDPEDLDGWQDDDGCPEKDNDQDGIEDASDACPVQPETVNGWQDDDGCPDQVPADVTAALATVVRFEPRRARITQPASAALRKLLAVLRARPALRLAIVGRPDRAGGEELARRRADAVKWFLVDQGITPDRLSPRVGPVAKGPAVSFGLAETERN